MQQQTNKVTVQHATTTASNKQHINSERHKGQQQNKHTHKKNNITDEAWRLQNAGDRLWSVVLSAISFQRHVLPPTPERAAGMVPYAAPLRNTVHPLYQTLQNSQ